MRHPRFIMLALVFAVAFPSGFSHSPVAGTATTDPAGTLTAASPRFGGTIGAVVAAGKDAGRARGDSHTNRKHDAHGRKRKHDGKRNTRNHSRSQRGPTPQEREQLWEEKCDGPGSIKLPKSQECTHGPDLPPPGVDATRRSEPLAAAAASRAVAALECDGNGQSGPRVQVLYARASDVPDGYDEYLASFRAWTADADTIMRQSATEAGGGSRRFRFVTTPGCEIDVRPVTLTPSGDDSFDEMIFQLKSQGYTRSDRKYLIYVDTSDAGICGYGSWWDDDSPGQANWNNYGPSYSRVDAGCWGPAPFGGGWTAAHELMHNLGGVQLSAPHSNGSLHCIDAYDVMCYKDSPSAPEPDIICPDEAHEERFDCNHDDYFHPAPTAGSYLATHWNTANNRFLVGGGNGGDDNGVAPSVTWVAPVGNRGTHHVANGVVALQVNASDPAGIHHVEFWLSPPGGSTASLFATDSSAPFTASVAVSDLSRGFNSITAVAVDGARAHAQQYIVIANQVPRAGPDPGNTSKTKDKKKKKKKKKKR